MDEHNLFAGGDSIENIIGKEKKKYLWNTNENYFCKE